MRNALALALALLASSALPAQAEIQSPSRPAPLVFDQTTRKTEERAAALGELLDPNPEKLARLACPCP